MKAYSWTGLAAAMMILAGWQSSARAEDGAPSTSALSAMGLSGMVVMSDDQAMSVRGMGFSGGGSGGWSNGDMGNKDHGSKGDCNRNKCKPDPCKPQHCSRDSKPKCDNKGSGSMGGSNVGTRYMGGSMAAYGASRTGRAG
jgi:hypothetical protein